MPFPTPSIRIRLTGLLAFFFERDAASPPNITGCRIGIHNDAVFKQHKMRVNVYAGPRDRPHLVHEFFTVLDGLPPAQITLTVTDPDPIAPGVIICPQTTGPFSTPADDELGFNLIPDIEGPDFDNNALAHSYNRFIRLNNGVFYTRITKPGWILRAPILAPLPPRPARTTFKAAIGIEAGINIYLQDPITHPASMALLTLPNGSLTFRKEAFVHELEMLNDCPVGVASSSGMFESDFNLYYDQMNPAPPQEERYSIVFSDGGTGRLSFDHPCGPIFGGKS